jgi:hypothetical protein
MLPRQTEKIRYSGYPGMDSDWLNRFRNSPGERNLRILFITRKIEPYRGEGIPTNDPFALDEREFERLIGMLSNALSECGVRAEVTIKPHPSNDFSKIRRRFLRGNFKRIDISFEPIYYELERCDLVCSVYSTTLLVPVAAGLPVFLFHSKVQDVVNRHEVFERLYTGLRYYIRTQDDLARAFKEHQAYRVARRKSESVPRPWAGDIEHVRSFFPDGATSECLSGLRALD